MRNEVKGFTLIELMVVIAIVSILAVIAYPSYSQYVIRANRSAAQQFMLDVASRAEGYRLDARDYPTALGAGAGELSVAVPADVAAYYTVALVRSAGPPSTYTITASPVAGSRQAADGTLSLTSVGTKSPAEKW
jgi:type IV pilus assembly protein PilE